MSRAGEGRIPSAREVLHDGDVLALAGTREAVEAASALLRSGRLEEDAAGSLDG
jgi:hypothetical protein